MIRKIVREATRGHRLRASLFFNFSHCPAGCDDGSKLEGPSGHVYRSSLRSITLRCTRCGLLWTMTVHQLAKSATRLGTFYEAKGNERMAALQRQFAAEWAEWAGVVNDQRGRKKTPR